MITVDEAYAERLLSFIRCFKPIFPDYLLEKAELLETQLADCRINESLLLQIYDFITKYIKGSKSNQTKKSFFETGENHSSKNMSIAQEMAEIIQMILLDQTQTDSSIQKHRWIRR